MGSSAKPVDLLSGSAARRRVRATARRRALALTDMILEQMAPSLTAAQSGAGLSRDQCMEVVDRMQEEISTAQLRSCRNYLRARLRKLSEQTGGKVVLPPRETYVRRDESPMARDAMTLVRDLEILIEQFMADVRNNLPNLDGIPSEGKEAGSTDPKEAKKRCKLTLGRILFSAIVNGGLINEPLYRRLLPALCTNLHGLDDCAWVTFPLDQPRQVEGDGEHAESLDAPVRRWFLDPVTLGLVTRWRASRTLADFQQEFKETSAHAALTYYLSWLRKFALIESRPELGRKWTPRSLISATRARLSLHLPQVLIRFLSSVTAGQSMSERTWWRYRFDRLIPQVSPEPHDTDASSELATGTQQIKHAFNGDKSAFYSIQQEFVEVLMQCLSEPGNGKKAARNSVAARAIKAVLAERRADMSPLMLAYYHWIAWKLERPSKKQGRIRAVSAKRYTSRLGRALIALGAELKLDDMSAPDWEEFYDDVLDSMESDLDRRKAIGNLQDFHRYLMITVNAPGVVIDGQADARASPRVTLVTERDYRRLMKALSIPDREVHRVRVLRLVVMLMYRIGLRPREIVGLEFRHIQGYDLEHRCNRTADPVLYLRATSREVLKTSSAVRQIPLRWFLDDEELDELRSYLDDRLSTFKEQNPESLVVFTPALGTNTQIREYETFGLITNLLRQVTGDDNVVAYSLRHSCLTNCFFELFRLDGHRRFGKLRRNGHLARETTYAISTLAGHLDPDISLQSYIHLQDYVAHLHLRALHAEQPLAFWASLEAKRPATLHQRRSRHSKREESASGDPETPQWLDTSRRLIRELAIAAPERRRRGKIEFPELEAEPNSLLDLDIGTIHALFVSLHRNYARESRARLFDLPVWQVDSLREWAVRLGRHHSEPNSGRRASRTLRTPKKHKRLPARFRRAQPGVMAPAPPNYRREEMEEANRIHRLLIKRARELRLNSKEIKAVIIDPIVKLLFAHSRSEAVVRVTDSEQLARTVDTLRGLNIPPERIELELEALPSDSIINIQSWSRQLQRIGKSRKLRMCDRNPDVTRRSSKYPAFGIVKVRVLELAKPNVGELARRARGRAGDRAGAGWRVGCFYAIATLTAVLWPR